jgi:ABC-type proline/glycine betaine transport system permease subunit
MNFDFLLNKDVAIFVLAVILFGGWQIAKLANPKWFYPIDENQKKKVAEIINTTNIGVAIIAVIIFAGLGIVTNFFMGLTDVFAVFAAGSFFELFKAYGAVK